MTWKALETELPEALKTRLGAVPMLHEDTFFLRVGSAVMVAAAPPSSLFPAGPWTGISDLPSGIMFHQPTRSGIWSVAESTDGQFLRIAEQQAKNAHFFYYKKTPMLTLHHVRGAQRLGAVGSATVGAAQAVVAYFTSNACTTASVPEVVNFQNAWNADQSVGSSSRLTVDGQYGPLTQGALENALGTTAVPANCFGGPAQPPAPDNPNPPPPGVLPAPSPSPTVASTGVGPLPYIIGAVVVAGALAAYTYSSKKKGHH